jgi:hypothetical protein
VWRPLIAHSRDRHLKFRRRLERMESHTEAMRASHYLSSGV